MTSSVNPKEWGGDKIITVDHRLTPQLKFRAKKDLLQPNLIGGGRGEGGPGGSWRCVDGREARIYKVVQKKWFRNNDNNNNNNTDDSL